MASIVTTADMRTVLGLSDSITSQESAILDIVLAQSEARVKAFLGYDPTRASRTQYYPRRDLRGVRGRRFWDVNTTHTRAVLVDASVTEHLQLENIPLISIGSLLVDRDGRFGTSDDPFASGSEWTEGDDFFPEYDQDGLCRSGVLVARGGWPVTAGSIKVTYTAGYSQADFDGTGSLDGTGIKRGVMLTAVKAFHTWTHNAKHPRAGFTAGPLKSERLQDYNYTLGSLSDQLAGMVSALPAEAEDELGPYVNYGIQVL